MEDIKPQKYLGYVSLRTGTVICGITEIFVGSSLWLMLGWIRPQLQIIALLYLLVFTIIGCIGIVAGARKSVACTWAFVVGLLISITLSALIGLEFIDAIHFLPQPPVAPTSRSDIIPLSAAANVTPLSAVVGSDPNTVLAKTAEHAFAEAKKKEKKEQKQADKAKHAVGKAEEKAGLREKSGGSPISFWAFKHRNVLIDLDRAGEFSLFRPLPYTVGLAEQFVSVGGVDDDEEAVLHAKDIAEAQAQKLVKGAPAKGVSEEELSVDELPAIYGELSRDSQKLLEAQLKGMKHLLRMGFGVGLIILSVMRLYNLVCSLSWALNECRSFDSLKDAPDQYEPLIVAPDEKIGARDLDLDDESAAPPLSPASPLTPPFV